MSSFSNKSFEIWNGPNVEIVYIPYEYKSKLSIEEYWNPNLVYDLFARCWKSSIFIAVLYVITIRCIENLMTNHRPFTLKKCLFLWNAALAIFSTIGMLRSGEEFFYVVLNKPFTHSICYSINPNEPVAFWACAFALSKVAELFDTIFLVLRKKKVIFLHWYHHVVVLIYSWNSAVEVTAAGRWFIFMNFTVHSIMYSYYAFASVGIRFPKIISMIVTILQTSQMLIGVTISCIVYYLRSKNIMIPCQQSYENLTLCFSIYLSFAILFMNFFIKNYLSRKEKKKLQ
uniref:Elongation of very long chain fatty acids protein n=1 Tax=Parastrongyloides trichosuri TaxID=131310 RepID=A0A0N4ZHF9_PARTI